jgi:purine nucleoside permease
MVTVLLPSAKEARGKKMLNKKDNNNRRRNRFILTPCRKYPVILKCHIRTARLYHAGFSKAIHFTNESELQIAFSCKSGYG